MKTAELLACPICGKPPMCQTAERASNGELYQLAGVWCKPCRIDAHASSDEEATRKWNDRAGRKPEAVPNSEAQGQFAPCPGSVAASEQSIWLEYKHATPPQAIVKGYEADENECVAELLNGIPNEGGSATKATFENLVRMAFQGGLAASITRKQ